MKVKCNCCGHIYDINATAVLTKTESKVKTLSPYKKQKKKEYQRNYYLKRKQELLLPRVKKTDEKTSASLEKNHRDE